MRPHPWPSHRQRHATPTLAVVVLLLAPMAWASPAAPDPPTTAAPAIEEILLLSSWAEHLPWSRDLFLGVEQGLAAHAGDAANLYTEHLDRSRLGQGLDDGELATLLRRKYRHVTLDGVIVDAAPAIEFVLRHGLETFGDIPFVLLPGTRIDASALPTHAIIELAPSVQETITLALRQNPATRQVLLIGDRSGESQAVLRETRQVLASLAPDIQVRVLSDFTVATLERQVSALPRHALIVYTLVFRDRSGQHWRPVDVLERLARHAAVPIYVFYDSMIGAGAVGGHVQSAGRAGETAVQAIVDLAGNRQASPSRYRVSDTILDWRILQKWGIKTGIPGDAEIRHRKPRIWEVYFRETLAAVVFMVSQTVLMVIIAVLYLQRRRITTLQGREAELSRARQEAERANRHKSEFFARIGHELRAPLGIILGYADLLHHAPEHSGPARQQIRLIRASALHLRQLIDDLLDVAAIETQRLRAVMADTDLRQLLEEVATMMAASAAEKNLAFHSRLDPALPARVVTDGRRLRQVLLNLLGNAVKYTEAGGVTLVVRVLGEGAHPAIRFMVADTGVGITPGERARLFHAFQQAHSGHVGSGLGLAIARELVHLLGGRLRLHSRPGSGSCFGFRLPVSVLPDTASDSAPPVTGYAGPRRRLLIIDDEPEQRALLRDLLAPLGFEIQLAADRAAALAWLETARPSLVLMDLHLGADSGHALTRILRQRLAPAPLPVIAVSALPPPPDGAADREPFDAHLLKPVTLDSLLGAIGECLDLRWLRGSPPGLALPTPPRLEIDTVMELVRWGAWQQVEEWCDDLAGGQPELAAFAAEVRARAARRAPQPLLDWLAGLRAASL